MTAREDGGTDKSEQPKQYRNNRAETKTQKGKVKQN